MEQGEVCFAPVLDLREAATHPHNVARGTFVEVDGHVQPAPAPRFSRTPNGAPRAGVPAGVDVQAALAGWGLDRGEIEALVELGALA